MDAGVRWEIQSCIHELRSISSELEEVAGQIDCSISGMSTWKYTNALRKCADKYKRAAGKLENIDE